MINEKYFVASEGDKPEQIFFTDLDAFVSGYKYIDSFDEDGVYVQGYELDNNCYINI